MTNAVLIQMAVLAVSAVVVGIVIRSRKHATEAAVPLFEPKTKSAKVEEARPAPAMETTIVDNIPQTGQSEIVIDVQSAFIRRDDRNERILDGEVPEQWDFDLRSRVQTLTP